MDLQAVSVLRWSLTNLPGFFLSKAQLELLSLQ